jgi:hypothetical protein
MSRRKSLLALAVLFWTASLLGQSSHGNRSSGSGLPATCSSPGSGTDILCTNAISAGSIITTGSAADKFGNGIADPGSPANGDFWYSLTNPGLFKWYDGTNTNVFQGTTTAAKTNNAFAKFDANGRTVNSSVIDNGTTLSTAEPITTTAAGAGAFQCTQGSAQGHATANSITDECPAAVTAYEVVRPGTAAAGLPVGTLAAGVITQGFSGDSGHATGAVTIGSGSSIAATSLCSTANCPAGNYQVNVYVEITTACTTTGSYIVWLGYTDDATAKTGSSTTTFIPINGLGVTQSTGSLALASTVELWSRAATSCTQPERPQVLWERSTMEPQRPPAGRAGQWWANSFSR